MSGGNVRSSPDPRQRQALRAEVHRLSPRCLRLTSCHEHSSWFRVVLPCVPPPTSPWSTQFRPADPCEIESRRQLTSLLQGSPAACHSGDCEVNDVPSRVYVCTLVRRSCRCGVHGS